VAGGLVGGVFLMTGLALGGAALGVHLSTAAAWAGPRLRPPVAALVATNTVLVGAVGFLVG
jgi:hypothetical protein